MKHGSFSLKPLSYIGANVQHRGMVRAASSLSASPGAMARARSRTHACRTANFGNIRG
jgi:hypothetical protein